MPNRGRSKLEAVFEAAHVSPFVNDRFVCFIAQNEKLNRVYDL